MPSVRSLNKSYLIFCEHVGVLVIRKSFLWTTLSRSNRQNSQQLGSSTGKCTDSKVFFVVNNNDNNPVKTCAKRCTVIHSERGQKRKDTHTYNHWINISIQLCQSIYRSTSTGNLKHSQITQSLDVKNQQPQTATKIKNKIAQAAVV